ncbi:ATP-binding cassette domain-containing protein [Streptomyces cyaneofuscatus]|uniref:ATP-binding cassette domain-containing protein n=1 Tax=Streptomyces cyaneofuscatus TaxID=66883 RepID=UPI0033BAE2E7
MRDREPTTGNAIVAKGLRKEYGDFVALDGLDLAVPEGTVCGLLGPNGAGKTTAVRILCSLLRQDGGRASVAGFDTLADAPEVRYRIGLTGQSSAVDEVLTGRQNLMMFARLYHLDRETARARADELLGQFSLTEAADKSAKTYSGGMRRRLDLAASFIMAPQVLFLDEPTTGLDPRHRTEVWDVVRSLVEGGTTVLLTSHYLDEVDQLADNIVVVDRGRKITEGTPEGLKARVGGDRIDTVIRDSFQLETAAEVIRRVVGSEPEIDAASRRVSVSVRDRVAALTRIARSLEDDGITAQDIALRRPTLDEVFMRLTGDRDNAKAEVDR